MVHLARPLARSRPGAVAGTLAVLVLAGLAGLAGPASAAAPASVAAAGETTPVGHSKDAADDPALWIDTNSPARSLVIGTDKQGALETYDLDGDRVQRISGDYGNNVDVRGDIVVSADPKARKLHVYRVDQASRQLSLVGNVTTKIRSHGLCLYQSPVSGTLYALPNAPSGVVVQYALTVGSSSVTASQKRRFDVGTSVEGCTTDETTKALYISEEDAGTVWRYGAEPNSGTSRTLVDSRASSGRYPGDAEGIAVVDDWVIVSSQGDSTYNVYDRDSNAYLASFAVAAGQTADGCSGTDGVEAYAGSLGSTFPAGVFVCQDGHNTTPGSKGNQDFKLVDLAAVRAALR